MRIGRDLVVIRVMPEQGIRFSKNVVVDAVTRYLARLECVPSVHETQELEYTLHAHLRQASHEREQIQFQTRIVAARCSQNLSEGPDTLRDGKLRLSKHDTPHRQDVAA